MSTSEGTIHFTWVEISDHSCRYDSNRTIRTYSIEVALRDAICRSRSMGRLMSSLEQGESANVPRQYGRKIETTIVYDTYTRYREQMERVEH